jgi:tRNA A37 threonylcarbamoyladenosine dehydratase
LNPSQINADNLNNAGYETTRHFGNKKREYFKGRINELETNSEVRNIRDFYRGIYDFKEGYQSRTD